MSSKALLVSAAIALSAPVLADTGATFMGARDPSRKHSNEAEFST